MKKCLFLILLVSMLLIGCGSNEYSSDVFKLYSITLNGEEYDYSEVYPNGLSIIKTSNNEWTIVDGDIKIETPLDNDILLINNLKAEVNEDLNGFSLIMEDTGLIYYFSNLESPKPVQELTKHTEIQMKYVGDYQGRIYFYNTKGKWSEYEGSSLSVKGNINISEEGEGSLKLYSDYYSSTMPIVDLNIIFNNDKIIGSTGTVLEYKLSEGYFDVEYIEKALEDVNNMDFVDPYEYSWYVPEEEQTEEINVYVFDVDGECDNGKDFLNFNIEITKIM